MTAPARALALAVLALHELHVRAEARGVLVLHHISARPLEVMRVPQVQIVSYETYDLGPLQAIPASASYRARKIDMTH